MSRWALRADPGHQVKVADAPSSSPLACSSVAAAAVGVETIYRAVDQHSGWDDPLDDPVGQFAAQPG